MSKPRIAVNGACGRMGQKIVAAVAADNDLELAAAVEAPRHPSLGNDIGVLAGIGPVGVLVSTDLPPRVDGVVDFSVPEASLRIAQVCADRQIPLLVATTGLSTAQREELVALHHTMPLLIASNCSLVVNVLMKLTSVAAKCLAGKDFDVEIVERHHRFKADAPSGTALTLADVVQEEMGQTERCYGRQGIVGQRPRHQIGIHAIRTGDNVGEHTVIFSTMGETLELVHRGHSRDSYVTGALEAIKFLLAKQPGLYSMADVLGL